MGLINITDIQNGAEANDQLFNSRFGAIVNELNGNIDADNLKLGAVATAKIADSAVTTTKINNLAVTSAKIGTVSACRVSRSAVQSVANAATTIIAWDTELFDTDNMHDNVTANSRHIQMWLVA